MRPSGRRVWTSSAARLVPVGYGTLGLVFASDDMGRRIDARYSVERDGDLLALVLESSSGHAPSRPARNIEYRHALAVLLGRLRDLGAVLQDGVVDSAF